MTTGNLTLRKSAETPERSCRHPKTWNWKCLFPPGLTLTLTLTTNRAPSYHVALLYLQSLLPPLTSYLSSSLLFSCSLISLLVSNCGCTVQCFHYQFVPFLPFITSPVLELTVCIQHSHVHYASRSVWGSSEHNLLCQPAHQAREFGVFFLR